MVIPLLIAGLLPLAQSSPWWENYDSKTRFLCPDRSAMVLERNEAQASLFTGRYRTTLFRENGEGPAIRYTNDALRVILRGDELTVEHRPMPLTMTMTCVRTEQV